MKLKNNMEKGKIGYELTNKNKSILLKVNFETLDFDLCDRAQLDIDYTWFIEEDGLLEYAGNVYEVKAGDSVLMLYSSTEETKNLPYNERVRELVIIEKDSAFGKLINRKRNAILEERKISTPMTIEECCDKPNYN